MQRTNTAEIPLNWRQTQTQSVTCLQIEKNLLRESSTSSSPK